MVSHYDCEKQHTFRRFNSLKVKQCTEAPSNIQRANVTGRVCFRAKAKRIKAYKCVAYAKKEKQNLFSSSVKYRRVDRTVWNHNTMALPVTLDPLECTNNIRHLNGTNNKMLNNLKYNKTIHTVGRSLISRKTRTISNSFYCIPIEQNVHRHFHFHACRLYL